MTRVISFASNRSEKMKNFIKENTVIEIQRSADDNGQNGNYFKSNESVKLLGIPLNSIDVQSTADWKSKVDAGEGYTIPAGTYTGILLNKSGSYKEAISISGNGVKESESVLLHPNVFTAKGATEEYGQGSSKGRPLSLGCQISHLEDFNEVTNILKTLGFNYGKGSTPWSKGDETNIKIKAPKN